jgi:hypothetical protein
MKRFCLPPAATPSRILMSSGVSTLYASNAPVKLDSIRDGVTDLGRTIMSFATVIRQVNYHCLAERMTSMNVRR